MSFKICVTGCGGIAFQMHGHAYKRYAELHNDTILAACCDIDSRKAGDFREQFGFAKSYTDYRVMLREEKPDAVCLNAPVPLTASIASEILQAEFPLILEKPPGKNRDETLRILEAAEKGKQIHQVAFNRRFIPVLEKLAGELRAQYRPEEIQSIGCEFFRVNRRDADFSTTAIHGIDTVRFLAGSDYEEIHFYYREMPKIGEGAGDFFLQGQFRSGACTQLRFCPMTGARFERITVNVGDSTYLALLPYVNSTDSPGRLLHYRNDKIISEINGEEICGSSEIFMTNGFYQEDASFFDAVKSGKQPESNLQSALQSVEIADCIRKRQKEYFSKV